MRYSIRKFIRDIIVTAAGAALLFVAEIPIEQLPDIGQSELLFAGLAPVAGAAYRELRENFGVGADIDPAGE